MCTKICPYVGVTGRCASQDECISMCCMFEIKTIRLSHYMDMARILWKFQTLREHRMKISWLWTVQWNKVHVLIMHSKRDTMCACPIINKECYYFSKWLTVCTCVNVLLPTRICCRLCNGSCTWCVHMHNRVRSVSMGRLYTNINLRLKLRRT
mgnify:CR=1 FL=1